MIIKEKYNVNDDVEKHNSLLHKVNFKQMNAKKAIKTFEEREITAIFKEYKQLDDEPMPDKPSVTPFNPDEPIPLDRKKKLNL